MAVKQGLVVEAAFQQLYKGFVGTKLIERTYAKLPMGPNRHRPEDIHVIQDSINLREIYSIDEFIERVSPTFIEVSYRVFAQGNPLGFWNLSIPGGIEYYAIHQLENPAHGLQYRCLMQYDIGEDAYVFAVTIRPEYDEEIIKQIMQPGTSAGLL